MGSRSGSHGVTKNHDIIGDTNVDVATGNVSVFVEIAFDCVLDSLRRAGAFRSRSSPVRIHVERGVLELEETAASAPLIRSFSMNLS